MFNPHDALEEIVKLLATDGHIGDDDELYAAFLNGSYGGCVSCAAMMTARAALDGKRPKVLVSALLES